MILFNVPTTAAGRLVGGCLGEEYLKIEPSLKEHQEGVNRLWPEDPLLTEEFCKKIWAEIFELRNEVSFLIGSVDDAGEDVIKNHMASIEKLSKNAVLLELMDKEIGSKQGGYVEMIWDFICDNPFLIQSPNNGTRVYH